MRREAKLVVAIVMSWEDMGDTFVVLNKRVRERETERKLPSIGSLPRCLLWPGKSWRESN